MNSSKLAYEAWKSNDPKQWDQALAERDRLIKNDPKAWNLTMKEITKEEEQVAQIKIAEQQAQELAAAQAKAEAVPAPQPADAPAQAAPPAVQMTEEVVTPAMHPGYAPASPFAPAPPNSPAYDAAYNQPPAKFYGINAGLFKIGVTNHGSLDLGVNIGLARAEVQAGLENRVDGELMPIGGTIHARVGAGVGVNQNGFHGEAGAGANFFNIAGGDADVGARLGRDVGVDADVRGRALFVNGQGDAGASLGERGLQAYGGGNADLAQTLGARGGARVSLGDGTGVAAGVGLNAAGNTLDFGPSIDANKDGTVTTGLHLDPSKSDVAPFYPTGDRTIDPQ